MAFTLPPLPYPYDALEPHIDEATMKLHHGKHHQAYVDKLNAAIAASEWESKSIDEIMVSLDKVPDKIKAAVRNNGGGHYNHSLFWQWMSPTGGGEPSGKVAEAINAKFGSFAKFKEEFEAAGMSRFGSGWVWLIQDGGELSIVTTPYQDCPVSEGKKVLLGNDLWEHAYYLKYQNRRPEYLAAWWNVVNWNKVTELFNQ
ncbi:MAG: superoxide dismutase [Actinobacteria bacterium BACL2 MAG-120820-bin50]|uniref:Superoxide dismutase n=1 Tax=Actinobacteria bacterium BACL2 MAG-120820-bin50 TaxID=1655570 RepID=A0A0R2QWK6_9ACTN|nr:MAG: superoxide dismutase [Actinobacteria bacterium BACL2 MAG-120820-bin50]